MTRARLWASGVLLAAARALAGKTPEESTPVVEEDDSPPPVGPALTRAAVAMLVDGEARALDFMPKRRPAEKPRPGSLAARAAAAREGRGT